MNQKYCWFYLHYLTYFFRICIKSLFLIQLKSNFLHFQELPKAEALLAARELNENDLQNLDNTKSESKPTEEKKEMTNENSSDSDSDTDSTFSENEDGVDSDRIHIRLPLDLDLSELANAVLQNNQK